MISNSSLIHTFFSIGIPTLLRPEDILNVSIQSQEAILSGSANNDPTEDDLNPAPCTLELDKDALIDRIQQQQFHRERVGSLPTSCTPVLDDAEHDDELEDDEDVDDEAKDEDSKRHDHKAGRIISLGKDYYIDGQKTRLILFEKNFNWRREKGPPNYTPGVDFLDHNLF